MDHHQGTGSFAHCGSDFRVFVLSVTGKPLVICSGRATHLRYQTSGMDEADGVSGLPTVMIA